MARNMSFALTTNQFVNQTKTVTRRIGWKFIKVGDVVNGCEKCQGLQKGEQVKKLGQIHILKTSWESLGTITAEDCALEGFPNMTPAEFVKMFCQYNKCTSDTLVNRIEFEYRNKRSCNDYITRKRTYYR